MKMMLSGLCILLLFLLFSVGSFAKTVDLSWDASPSVIAGYKLYYKEGSSTLPLDGTGAANGSSPIVLGDILSYTVTDLPDTTGHYFALTAYDAAGYESTYSNIVYSPEIAAVPTDITSVVLSESQQTGGAILYTATGAGSNGVYEYEFWLYDPLIGWNQTQAYTTENTWSWIPLLIPGNYRIAVNGRVIGTELVAVDLLEHQVESEPATSITHITSYIYQATASGGTAPYEYEFWLYRPMLGWSQVQSFTLNNTWLWEPPSESGTYWIAINARSVGSTTTVLDLIEYIVP